MTVAEPHYRIQGRGDGVVILEGGAEVAEFYSSLTEDGLASVFGPIHEKVQVDDWGVASHGLWGYYFPGHVLAAAGDCIDDVDAWYHVTNLHAGIWRYNTNGLLEGENVYIDSASRRVEKLADDQVLTAQEALEFLQPALEAELASTEF
ncbi:hypothetical protein [Rhodococcus opacus]|nr:hypothetical protein [Rhodococcus opacus]